MRLLVAALLISMTGCASPVFTELGNGITVRTESVEAYAEEHGVSREEAREQLLQEVMQSYTGPPTGVPNQAPATPPATAP